VTMVLSIHKVDCCRSCCMPWSRGIWSSWECLNRKICHKCFPYAQLLASLASSACQAGPTSFTRRDRAADIYMRRPPDCVVDAQACTMACAPAVFTPSRVAGRLPPASTLSRGVLVSLLLLRACFAPCEAKWLACRSGDDNLAV
jgi:hypothetical protein